jgi:hypothetical protein
MDGEAVMAVIHPEVDRIRLVAVDQLQAEDLRPEFLPLLELGRLDSHVSQGPYLHCPSSFSGAVRKPITSRSNSRACSTWAQWPQLGNTCNRASGM